ncbi:hypothetical protein KTO58_18025 [Chitinophaga pendula]|uniref:hypothetical protein n=1 Tax=Chitinophaga TaxID=79328 RepID=UPI000BAFC0C9|nr:MULTISPECIES: hypothetical protein [Chitinophaga]ASZ11413.1 hypothetical protein CK934_10800 [Chitinophaga sp. MD30]UCJ05583.1 hypothetical protein KTO58_18025 [Chitinophaga pendula]
MYTKRRPYHLFAIGAAMIIATACQSGTKTAETQHDSLIGKVDTIPEQPAAEVAASLMDAALADTTIKNWEASGMASQTEFIIFFNKFKEWVAADQKDSIIANIDFPIAKYKTGTQFKTRYEKIFDNELKKEVAAAEVKDLWANYQGVSMNNGIFWFNQIKGRYVVTAVNK